MLTLLTYPAMFGQFSASPFCLKAACLLAASGQPWQRQDLLDPRNMPHGKLPVLRAPEGLISGSDRIQAYLEAHGAAFDHGLDPRQQAAAHGFVRLAEEHLYLLLVLDRWGNDDVWPTIRESYFASIPGILRRLVTNRLRAAVLRGLHVQGIARLSPTERLERAEQDFAAIRDQLAQAPFLFSDEPTRADFSVAAMLLAILATPGTTALQRHLSADPVLSAYAGRFAAAVPQASHPIAGAA